MTKECPVCGKIKEEKEFQHIDKGGKTITRIVCNLCADKMSKRLGMLADVDVRICEQLGLNFMGVTDYEAKVRHKGLFHREGNWI